MSGTHCPILKPSDDPEIILSNYSTSAGTYVIISCRKFAHHVTPSDVTCVAEGSTVDWEPTPNFSCEYNLDSREKLLLGVFISTGLLFLLCIICIAAGGVFGDHWRTMWTRYYQKGDYFDNERSYPLDEYPPYRGRFDDLDDQRKEYTPYDSRDEIDRYDNRYPDYHQRKYFDDRDYWQHHRYSERDDLINRSSFHSQRVNNYQDNRGYVSDNKDKAQIWYTREIIEYYDNGNRHSNDEFDGVPRHPDEPRTREFPRERLAILDNPPPPKEAVPFIFVPPEESVAVLDAAPIESVVATSEKIILDIDHEPEYVTTDYKDLGFYALDKAKSSYEEWRPVNDNTAYIHDEPLYAKPIKPKAKVTIDEGEGRGHPGNHDNQIVPYRSGERPDANNSDRKGWHGSFQTRPEAREPIVDEKLHHMLYHGRGHVTEVYDNNVMPDIPRVSFNQVK